MDFIETELIKLNTSINKIDQTIKMITELRYDKNLSNIELDSCLDQLNMKKEELAERQEDLCKLIVDVAELAAYEEGLIPSIDF